MHLQTFIQDIRYHHTWYEQVMYVIQCRIFSSWHCIKKWWDDILKSKKFPLVHSYFYLTNVVINRFYCLNCKTKKCPACNKIHSPIEDNTIVVLCNGDKDDSDHKSHWFISNKSCYKSNGRVLGPVNNCHYLQDIKDKTYLDPFTPQSISELESFGENMVNMSLMPRVKDKIIYHNNVVLPR